MKVSLRANHLLSPVLLLVLVLLWILASHFQLYRSDLFPYADDFARTLSEELRNGRLRLDVAASLYRWAAGFFLSLITAVPLGLWLGRNPLVTRGLTPYLNFMRSLSPLAWIPFAVIWFGIGDAPVVFLIFLGCVFPLLFSTLQAVCKLPEIYDQLARDYGFRGFEYFSLILLPAVLIQIISSVRLVAALGWIVLVPAEMLAGKEGLGFAILDARNGMRTDLLVLNMIVIAGIAHLTDLILHGLAQRTCGRWTHVS